MITYGVIDLATHKFVGLVDSDPTNFGQLLWVPDEDVGHASITTTLDLYGHLYPGEMDRYAD